MKQQKAVSDKINLCSPKESANSRKGQNDKTTLPPDKIKFNYFIPSNARAVTFLYFLPDIFI